MTYTAEQITSIVKFQLIAGAAACCLMKLFRYLINGRLLNPVSTSVLLFSVTLGTGLLLVEWLIVRSPDLLEALGVLAVANILEDVFDFIWNRRSNPARPV